MPEKILYFDESGFTGYNLLDENQPVFVIASADIEPCVSKNILQTAFPSYQGSEFKFSNIWRSGNKAGLPTFSRELEASTGNAFVWMIDKRFAVLTKIVDFLIEPTITKSGYDFYADGFCWKYTNYIHFGITQLGEPELYPSLIRVYQNFSRAPSRSNLVNLQTQLGIMASSVNEELKVFFEQMSVGAERFEQYSNLERFRGSDELYVTSMIAAIGHWRQRHTEDFLVVHDASAHFFRHRDLWERITNNSVPTQLHPLGDGSFVEFPLRVASTTAIDSEANYSIQLCDILAGLAARHFDSRLESEDRELLSRTIEAGLNSIDYNGIRPDSIFPDHIPPRRLGGPDAVDRMTRIIFGPHNRVHRA